MSGKFATALFLLGCSLPLFAAAPQADDSAQTAFVFSEPNGVQLKVHVFFPETSANQRRPAIVLFHGGGWSVGEPEWAFGRAKHFAARGMVAVAAQYRLSDGEHVTPIEAMHDASAAVRWVRTESSRLGVDANKIAVYGWSAGAHLAASTAVFNAGDERSSPNALVLVSPAVSIAGDGHMQRLLGERAQAAEVSPDRFVRAGLPPTLILQGDVDTVTPLTGVKGFCDRLLAAGNHCTLQVYQGYGHIFTPKGIPDNDWPKPDKRVSADALRRADAFLKFHGFQ